MIARSLIAAILINSFVLDEALHSRTLIGNGKEVTSGYDWVVQLSTHQSGDGTVCTGSLIDRQWILTAAHCIIKLSNSADPPILQDELKRYARLKYYGPRKCGLFNDPILTTIRDNNFHPHPEARLAEQQGNEKALLLNDIALLKMDEPVNINPVAMFNGDRTLPNDGNVLGWGMAYKEKGGSADAFQNKLYMAPFNAYWDDEQCPAIAVQNNYFCVIDSRPNVAALKKSNICSGDSGGPFFAGGKRPVQYGVTSQAREDTPKFNNPNKPTLFTRVDRYQNWIQETIANN
uniref:Peptidase S1 domain-containing protein n=1 Tax=Mucochytrium quahogii TaxID=96639 RepID=A0A7S2WR39_9STRA|mmetsp:Transcript_6531/g.11484  ORF Transcript_6531/g.11484 Transcript_6531/m.11484 type:complete len:290 (+) Transcript_6531:3968-4837(+)|eukprot:CAMPEP_0203761500 /NCGR_PEP_ID=MMETSP0098-20131031/14577_1 /ASSEMBLY_ACC=CAM_ASM_000208 /TAXON_ID=96639 /ORGANISM=" , Strain NY0313808BC1" /LENGTH=289 /DNA_ID=CAMNT_0050655523 /DNA_START=1753 /DNA_END=2622 /DNA_ORIENTATION=-